VIELFESACLLACLNASQPELTADSDKFRTGVSDRAYERTSYIVALAKCKMLGDFGEDEDANAVTRPYMPATT
jgi:hypothetical protein